MGNSNPAAAGTAPKPQLARVRLVHASRQRFSADPLGTDVRMPIQPMHERRSRPHSSLLGLWPVSWFMPDCRLKPDRRHGRVR